MLLKRIYISGSHQLACLLFSRVGASWRMPQNQVLARLQSMEPHRPSPTRLTRPFKISSHSNPLQDTEDLVMPCGQAVPKWNTTISTEYREMKPKWLNPCNSKNTFGSFRRCFLVCRWGRSTFSAWLLARPPQPFALPARFVLIFEQASKW